MNFSVAEAAKLIDEFEVIIPTCLAAPDAGPQCVAALVGGSLLEFSVTAVEPEIINVNVSAWQDRQRSYSIKPPKVSMARRES